MADFPRSSRLKTMVAQGSHTFIIDDFLTKVKGMKVGSKTETFRSASFLAFNSDESLKMELQIVVNVGSNFENTNRLCVGVDVFLVENSVALTKIATLLQGKVNNRSRLLGIAKTKFNIPLEVHFSLLDDRYEVLQNYKPMKGYYTGFGYPMNGFLLLQLPILLMEPTRFLRSDESLAISCSVELDCGTVLEKESSVPVDPQIQLSKRLTPEKYPDMYLVSGKTRFPCHKHMLAACSDVFDAMFSHDSNERKTNRVIIRDLKPNALRKFIEFVYSDKIENFNGLAHHLIYAADKYNIVNLKVLAVNEAVQKLTVQNVCDFISLGEMVQSEYLLERAYKFAHNKIGEIKKTNGWKTLPQESLRKLFESVAKARPL